MKLKFALLSCCVTLYCFSLALGVETSSMKLKKFRTVRFCKSNFLSSTTRSTLVHFRRLAQATHEADLDYLLNGASGPAAAAAAKPAAATTPPPAAAGAAKPPAGPPSGLGDD